MQFYVQLLLGLLALYVIYLFINSNKKNVEKVENVESEEEKRERLTDEFTKAQEELLIQIEQTKNEDQKTMLSAQLEQLFNNYKQQIM